MSSTQTTKCCMSSLSNLQTNSNKSSGYLPAKDKLLSHKSYKMLSVKRYLNTILVVFAVGISTLAVYSLYYVPVNKPCTVPVTKAVTEEEKEKELVFDEVMSYILHPVTHCKSQVILGGVKHLKQLPDLDGDKIICLEPGPGLHEGCVVLSFGIGGDWSFEENIQERFKCKVFAFDPSINQRNHLHSEGIFFYDNGLGNVHEIIQQSDGNKWNMSTFDYIVDLMGLSGRTIDVVKMDIEGWEFPVLEDILQKGLFNKVNHLCVELHFSEVKDWRTTLKMLREITEKAGLGLFSTRINPFVPPLQVPGIPRRKEYLLYEMAWVRIVQPQNLSTAPPSNLEIQRIKSSKNDIV